MDLPFELIDPPSLVGIERHTIENLQGMHLGYSFAHFQWHEQDFWLLGKMEWHDIMGVGDVYLRLPKGRKLFRAGILVRPRSEPPTFLIRNPRGCFGKRAETFVFMGFSPRTVVDIAFVRGESQRLSALPFVDPAVRPHKLPRPQLGQVV